MNIYIFNCPNTFNYGSMMMGENFINYFNGTLGGKNNFYVETNEEINILRLREATGIKEIFSVKTNSLFKDGVARYDYIKGYIGLKKITSNLAKKIDLVVVLGGDDFTEDYGWKEPVINAIKFNVLKNDGLKVVMLGQTMGPYKSFRKPLMKSLLNNLDKIYSRDPVTYNYLKDLGISEIGLMDDLALLPLVKQEAIERTREYILYCPSELIYRYSKQGDRKDWINFNVFMIDEIIKKFPDKKLILLAHVLKPKHVDDRIMVNELNELVKEKYSENILVRNDEMYPYEVRNYIQQSLFTISSRMHPVVSSLQCEIPSIALSYSTKYWGIIGERYGLSDYIIDVRFLNYDEMKLKFINILDKINENYVIIQNKIKEKNEFSTDTIMKALNEIAKISKVSN